jgi:hypothetical protein
VPVPAQERGIGLRPTGLPKTDTQDDQTRPPPSPPLRARTAFLFAALAAAIGILVFVARKLARIVSGVRWTRFAAVPAGHPASSRAKVAPSQPLRGRRREYARSTRLARQRPSFPSLRGIGAFHLGISGPAREDVTFYVLTVVLSVAIGCLVALGAG